MTPELAAALAALSKSAHLGTHTLAEGDAVRAQVELIREALKATPEEPTSYVWGVESPGMGVFRMHSEHDARTYASEVAGTKPVRKPIGPWEDLPTDKNVSEANA